MGDRVRCVKATTATFEALDPKDDNVLYFVNETGDFGPESMDVGGSIYLGEKLLTKVYSPGNGVSISQSDQISVDVDENNANGLSVGQSGLALAEAEAQGAGLEPVDGAMTSLDKHKLADNEEIIGSFTAGNARMGYYIASTTGAWAKNSSYGCWIVRVSGLSKVAVTAGSSISYVTFLKSYTPDSGNTPPSSEYATGYSTTVQVSSNKTSVLSVPSDAEFMYFNTGTSLAAKPASVKITGLAYTQSDWEQDDSTAKDYVKNRPSVRKGTGTDAIVEGGDNAAVANYSHAEGHNTRAAGAYSHAEGYGQSTESEFTVTGPDSDGYYTASEAHGMAAYMTMVNYENIYAAVQQTTYSKFKTTPSLGQLSGQKIYIVGGITSNSYSHVEGRGCVAFGEQSHAEGYRTVTLRSCEHAEGKYNHSSLGSADATRTIHSVGVGTSMSDRMNAFEIMRNGDAYMLGVGGYNGKNAIDTGVNRIQDLIPGFYNKAVTIGPVSPNTISTQVTAGWRKICELYQYGTYVLIAASIWGNKRPTNAVVFVNLNASESSLDLVACNNTDSANIKQFRLVKQTGNYYSLEFYQEAVTSGNTYKKMFSVSGVSLSNDWIRNVSDGNIATLVDPQTPASGTNYVVLNVNRYDKGYAVCTSSWETTQAYTASLSGFAPQDKSIVCVYFHTAVQAGCTLNINSSGAKSIYYHGSAIQNGVIGDFCLAVLMYDAANDRYNVIACENQQVKSDWEAVSGVAEILHKPPLESGTGSNAIVEGDTVGNTASGDYSHAEGYGTQATGDYSHAEGKYNVSHNGNSASDQTLSSIGFGSPGKRCNAFEVMKDGTVYIYGVGGYDGTDPSQATDLATLIGEIETLLAAI